MLTFIRKVYRIFIMKFSFWFKRRAKAKVNNSPAQQARQKRLKIMAQSRKATLTKKQKKV